MITLGFAFYLPTEPRRSHIGRRDRRQAGSEVGSHGVGQGPRGSTKAPPGSGSAARAACSAANAAIDAHRARRMPLPRCQSRARARPPALGPARNALAVERVAGRQARLDVGSLVADVPACGAKPSRMRLRTRTLCSAQKHEAAPARCSAASGWASSAPTAWKRTVSFASSRKRAATGAIRESTRSSERGQRLHLALRIALVLGVHLGQQREQLADHDLGVGQMRSRIFIGQLIESLLRRNAVDRRDRGLAGRDDAPRTRRPFLLGR